MNNHMYEAQLNRHEEQIRDIEGRLHSYDLGLRWCEEQIKKLAGDDYSPVVVIDNPIEKEYGKLKGDHNLLKEAYKKLDDRYEREKANWSDKYNELKDSNDINSQRIGALYKELAKKISEKNQLTECLAKYAWRRVSNLEPSTTDDLEDHELYLFVVDGYPTPVKGKYHADSPSYITIIVDDGDGKGPQYKAFFFMDGCIRYWMPLPEMPDTAIK